MSLKLALILFAVLVGARVLGAIGFPQIIDSMQQFKPSRIFTIVLWLAILAAGWYAAHRYLPDGMIALYLGYGWSLIDALREAKRRKERDKELECERYQNMMHFGWTPGHPEPSRSGYDPKTGMTRGQWFLWESTFPAPSNVCDDVPYDCNKGVPLREQIEDIFYREKHSPSELTDEERYWLEHLTKEDAEALKTLVRGLTIPERVFCLQS